MHHTSGETQVYDWFILENTFLLLFQKGRHIETLTIVSDFKNLSFRKHYYWPGIEMLKLVRCNLGLGHLAATGLSQVVCSSVSVEPGTFGIGKVIFWAR
jgi:hypothetical protein